jgi:DNA-binding beta-propeller fold protein YncE
VSSTTFRTVDRRSGVTLRSRTIPDVWTLRDNGGGLRGTLSPNRSYAVIVGSSYSFTDANGAWTAKTTLAVMDTSLAAEPKVIELGGRYGVDAISDDGRSLYVVESTPAQLPTSSRMRIYDLVSRQFSTIAGDEFPDPGAAFRVQALPAGRFSFELYAGGTTVLVREDLDARAIRTLEVPTARGVRGEEDLMWSLLGTRDGRTLYVINPGLGMIDEIDVTSMTLRRTAPLNVARPDPGVLETIAAALHPVAYAKRGLTTGAVLTADGSTVYAIGETGVWIIDTATLKARLLSKDGTYQTLALSPDGTRIYVLGFDDGVISALSSRDGALLGRVPRYAWPSDIVAVDASP